jgi:hypothetical protein
VLASVVGGRDPGYDRDHDLEALSPSGSSVTSYTKESKDAFAGIKVTTNVTQERTSHSRIPTVNDDTESTKELVKKDSL